MAAGEGQTAHSGTLTTIVADIYEVIDTAGYDSSVMGLLLLL